MIFVADKMSGMSLCFVHLMKVWWFEGKFSSDRLLVQSDTIETAAHRLACWRSCTPPPSVDYYITKHKCISTNEDGGCDTGSGCDSASKLFKELFSNSQKDQRENAENCTEIKSLADVQVHFQIQFYRPSSAGTKKPPKIWYRVMLRTCITILPLGVASDLVASNRNVKGPTRLQSYFGMMCMTDLIFGISTCDAIMIHLHMHISKPSCPLNEQRRLKLDVHEHVFVKQVIAGKIFPSHW